MIGVSPVRGRRDVARMPAALDVHQVAARLRVVAAPLSEAFAQITTRSPKTAAPDPVFAPTSGPTVADQKERRLDTTATPAPTAAELDQGHPRKWWILVAVSVGMFMALLDVTIVNIAMPRMITTCTPPSPARRGC